MQRHHAYMGHQQRLDLDLHGSSLWPGPKTCSSHVDSLHKHVIESCMCARFTLWSTHSASLALGQRPLPFHKPT